MAEAIECMCGSKNLERKTGIDTYKVFRCRECGLVFLSKGNYNRQGRRRYGKGEFVNIHWPVLGVIGPAIIVAGVKNSRDYVVNVKNEDKVRRIPASAISLMSSRAYHLGSAHYIQ